MHWVKLSDRLWVNLAHARSLWPRDGAELVAWVLAWDGGQSADLRAAEGAELLRQLAARDATARPVGGE